MKMDPPCIRLSDVRQALRTLWSSSTTHLANPLHFLNLVDEALTDPDLPCTIQDREYIFNERLTELVSRCYSASRKAMRLGEPAVDYLDTLQEEAHCGSLVLLGWSWLYHHFVRVDMNLSAEVFCAAVDIDGRTLRRYQNRTIMRLTTVLISEEWQARQRCRRQGLYAMLPTPAKVQVFGREPLLAFLRRLWAQENPGLVFITGGPGIGKTTQWISSYGSNSLLL
jgi:hypothetical protein